MENKIEKKLVNDIFWYFTGAIVPSFIGLLRSPIFTRYFTPDEYGYYSLVFTTFSYMAIFLFSWINSCFWRFYHEYRKENSLQKLYRYLGILFLISSVLLIIISLSWLALAKENTVRELVFWSALHVITNHAINLYFIKVRLEEKAFQYNLFRSVQVIGAFIFLCALAFIFHQRIDAILQGQIIINVFIILFLVLNKSMYSFSFKIKVQKNELREIIKYGKVGLIANIGLVLLISSDRYIIALFEPLQSVGIYNQVYNLGQLSIYMLITVYFNTINPRLNKMFVEDMEGSYPAVKHYLHIFIMIFLPLTFYLSLFHEEVSFIMLGKEFRDGSNILPWISASYFVYGITLFPETRLKFKNERAIVIRGFIIAVLINICFNFVLIPLFNYKTAAITTFLSYLFLWLFFFRAEKWGFFSKNPHMKRYPFMLIFLSIQLVIDLIIRGLYDLKIYWHFIEAFVFFILYVFFINRKELKLFIQLYKSKEQ